MKNGSVRSIVSEFNGKSLNSPNDLCISKDGTLFFTDPTYGLRNDEIPKDYSFGLDVSKVFVL